MEVNASPHSGRETECVSVCQCVFVCVRDFPADLRNASRMQTVSPEHSNVFGFSFLVSLQPEHPQRCPPTR